MPPAEPAPASGTSRPLPRLLLLAAAALLVARVATGVWEDRHPPKSFEKVHWFGISDGAEESQRTRRPVLYEFSADWCGPCQVMSRELFSDEKAASRIDQAFIPVRVLDRQQEEGRNPPEVERLERTYAVRAFPTLVVAWPGETRYESLSGYRGQSETMSWLTRSSVAGRMRAMNARPDSVLITH